MSSVTANYDSCTSVSSDEEGEEAYDSTEMEQEPTESERITSLFRQLLKKTQDELDNNCDRLQLIEVMGHPELVSSLCLREIRLFSASQLKLLLPRFKGLEFLDFSVPTQVEEEPDAEDPVNLDWTAGNVNDFLRIIKENCIQLHRLDLNFIEDLSVNDLVEIAEKNPELSQLSLVDCLTLRDQHLTDLSEQLTSLEVLDLSCCSELEGQGVLDLVEVNDALTALVLVGVSKLSEEDLLKLSDLSGALSYLDLRGVEGCTGEVYEAFLSKNENLSEDNLLWGPLDVEEEVTPEDELESPSDSGDDEEDYEDYSG